VVSASEERVQERERGKTELHPVSEFVLPPDGIVLEELEKKLIEQALQRTKWNRSKAARLLGISLDTLRYRIEKYGMNQ
jgi:DNA-binding NtrC family response regulator